MAQPKWLEKYLRMKPDVEQIFDDLDQFRNFCVDFGHQFDESNLYNYRAQSFQDFMRRKEGKWVRNQWFAKPGEERKTFRPRNDTGYRGGYNRGGRNA